MEMFPSILVRKFWNVELNILPHYLVGISIRVKASQCGIISIAIVNAQLIGPNFETYAYNIVLTIIFHALIMLFV